MGKKSKWIIAAAAVLVAGAVIYGSITAGVSAELYKVSRGDINQYFEETAQVKSIDSHTVYIEGAGRITDIRADVGDTVKKDDILLTLDKTDLELQLKAADAGIAASKAQLESTELGNYANKIKQAEAAVNQAKIMYDSDKRNFENAKGLYESQALSKDEYEKARDMCDVALAALNTANLQLADIKKGSPDYLKNSYMAQFEQAEIRRDTIVNSIKKQEVRSPADGTIIERLVDENLPAVPQMAAFIIEDTDRLEIEANVLSDDINKVQIGNEVEISGKPLGDEILKGRVAKIAPAAKAEMSSLGVSQNRVPVTIEINSDTSLLKPGFSVDAKIITANRKDTLIVPDSSVFDYEGKSTIFVVENGKARLRSVEKGIESDDFIEILGGLKEEELILSKPDNSIKEGMRIK